MKRLHSIDNMVHLNNPKTDVPTPPFSFERPLVKKNISDKTKYLINKYLSKKKPKETNF